LAFGSPSHTKGRKYSPSSSLEQSCRLVMLVMLLTLIFGIGANVTARFLRAGSCLGTDEALRTRTTRRPPLVRGPEPIILVLARWSVRPWNSLSRTCDGLQLGVCLTIFELGPKHVCFHFCLCRFNLRVI
jgi:hypothetical protein